MDELIVFNETDKNENNKFLKGLVCNKIQNTAPGYGVCSFLS